MNKSNTSADLGGEAISVYFKIKKHSVLLHDSDSEDNVNITTRSESIREVCEQVVECFGLFSNKFLNKDAEYRLKKLKLFREDSQMQSLPKSVFDLSMNYFLKLKVI